MGLIRGFLSGPCRFMLNSGSSSLMKRLIVVAAAAMFICIPSQQAIGLSQTCVLQQQTSFSPAVGNGSLTDGSQPVSFIVPAGITSIIIDAGGAQAGFGGGTVAPFGAEVAVTVAVTPGDTLCVVTG